MHQIDCRLGLCPRPTGGAYIAGSGVGPTGNGKERGEKRREGREGGERTGREGRASRNKGGSKGAGGSMPPVVSVCNIFLRVGVGVQTYHAAYIQALCQLKVSELPHLSLTLTLAQPRCNCKCNFTLTLDSRYNKRHALAWEYQR